MFIDLFLTFAKIGLFTLGGVYAMISIIENACVEKKKWITHDEMMNITVIAESTPGPVAINCATYVGYKKGKLPGAVVATIKEEIKPYHAYMPVGIGGRSGIWSLNNDYHNNRCISCRKIIIHPQKTIC